MENAKIHRHRVEASRLEWKLVGVSLTEVESWIPPSGRLNHVSGEINAHRVGSNTAVLFRNVAR
ncbi:MAG: hypothetical protein V3T61_07200, partial [Acidobacteriota bacterium]